MCVEILKRICLGLQKCIREKVSQPQRPTLKSRLSKTLMNSCLNFNKMVSIEIKFLNLKLISPFLRFPSVQTCPHNFMEDKELITRLIL